MSTPKYFENFPNLTYALSVDKAGNQKTIEIKDFFHLLKVREDVERMNVLYEDYIVSNGQRPEQVSYELYGDERFYWIILQVNKIVDYYNDWPLAASELDDFIKNKYGNKADDIHHYETLEVKDHERNILLKGGIKVSSDFVFTYPVSSDSFTYLTSRPRSVSNREYEYDLNYKKSQIRILKPNVVTQFESEVRKYGRDIKRDIEPVSQLDASGY